MTAEELALTLDAAGDAAPDRVGAKAATLARASAAGFLVPPGVVVAPDEPVDAHEIDAVLGPGPYAVRSSSHQEDGAERSWAGQFESRVPVQAAELVEAVEKVRESGGERALAYGSSGTGAIPVLVQPVVRARAAGVAFSLDPRDGDERFVVVEAVSGLATKITDGAVAPARWRIGLRTGDSDRPAGEPLTTCALADVVALTGAVAEWLGRPCDIEWAWDDKEIWLLQARPITAAAWHPAPGEWTAANLRENVPGVVTPLTASTTFERILAETIDASLRRIGLAHEGEVVAEARRFYGHLYWRIDGIKQRLAHLPGFTEASFDESVGITPSYEGRGASARVTPRTLARAVRAVCALASMYAVSGRESRRRLQRFNRDECVWLALDWDALDDSRLSEAVARTRALHDAVHRHALTVTFLAEQAQQLVGELAGKVEASLDPPPDLSLLLAGVGDVATAAAAARIDALARRYVPDAPAVLAAATLDDLPTPVAAALREAIAEFGWMASADDELANPRWDEDPTLPLAFFKAAVRAQLDAAARGVGDPGAARRRLGEERRLLAAAGRWRPVFVTALRFARRYSALREETRVMAGRANRLLRRAVLAQGRRWVAAGVLAAIDDAFWLTSDELFAAVPPPDARERVSARRRHGRRFRNWEPPFVLRAAPPSDPITFDGRTLRGLPCSSGVVRGRAAVLRRLEDVATVEPGAILVLKHGNPGWTPAFLAAGGLVIEQSGLLSHTSVIARERGLPAVINVERATHLLDGQEVEVDGRRGVVTVLHPGIATTSSSRTLDHPEGGL